MCPEDLAVDFKSVQAHYDLSDEFFGLFLDPTMTYSCAYFPTGKETLEQAQIAKIDLALGKLELKKGERLLDIGCGWGYTARRAKEKYGTSIVGLTLSKNQFSCATRLAGHGDGLAFILQGWETYREPCDKIVCLGAFEHFTPAKYGAFFARCRELLPGNGLMLLQTITMGKRNTSFSFLRWLHFLGTQIFPEGSLPDPGDVLSQSRNQGFELLRADSLRPHYVRTLDMWAGNLERNRAQAVNITNEKTYADYIKYLTSAAERFRSGDVNVYQYLMRSL